MTTQTKADRQAAAQKAAATRKRNEKRETSQDAGRKAAATRHQNDAVKAAKRARKDAGNGLANLGSAAEVGPRRDGVRRQVGGDPRRHRPERLTG